MFLKPIPLLDFDEHVIDVGNRKLVPCCASDGGKFLGDIRIGMTIER